MLLLARYFKDVRVDGGLWNKEMREVFACQLKPLSTMQGHRYLMSNMSNNE